MISTGLADTDLVDRLFYLWNRQADAPALAFLHCVSCYPAPESQANLGAIQTLRGRYPGVTVGYSDHTMGNTTPLFAVAAGARIIEKHFTLDKNRSDFRDHSLSADPKEMENLVVEIRRLEQIMGNGIKAPQACEVSSASSMRRSITVARDVDANHELQPIDLVWLRHGSGVTVGQGSDFIGRRTNRSLSRGEIIRLEDLR
jgi:Sialic acid synthase